MSSASRRGSKRRKGSEPAAPEPKVEEAEQLESDSDSESESVPVGSPICIHDGEVYYSSVELRGIEYSTGDTVLLRLGENVLEPAEIINIWKDRKEDMWIEHRWYFVAENLPSSLLKGAGKLPLPKGVRAHSAKGRELLETDEIHTNYADSIAKPITVLSPEEFSERAATSGCPDGNAYFSRWMYHTQAQRLSRASCESRRARSLKQSERCKLLPELRTHGNIKGDSEEGATGSDPAREVESAAPSMVPTSAFDEALQRLHLSSPPKRLPCRESERERIFSGLCSALKGASPALYISGFPGTGKTATVKEVVRMMKDAHRKGELPKFQFVEVNGMRLQKPEQAYSIIWEALSGDFLAPTKALSRIEDHITNRKRSSVRSDGTRLLILVDELDHMRTKTELVLYNLFDWPMQPDAGICVVAIANIMDFPERLKSSVRSRIGKNRLVFRPYNVKEVETILMNRLAELPRVFKPEALQIAARKVASASGDVRSALQMCSRALEVCRGRGAKQVEIEDINKAARLIKNSPVVEAIQLGTPIERHIMAAVASVIFTTGAGDRGVQMELVHSRAEMTAKISGLSSLRMSLKEVAEVVNRLSHMGVLRQMQGDGRLPLVGINMQESLSIPQMLKDDKHALGAIPDDMRPRASAMSTFHR